MTQECDEVREMVSLICRHENAFASREAACDAFIQATFTAVTMILAQNGSRSDPIKALEKCRDKFKAMSKPQKKTQGTRFRGKKNQTKDNVIWERRVALARDKNCDEEEIGVAELARDETVLNLCDKRRMNDKSIQSDVRRAIKAGRESRPLIEDDDWRPQFWLDGYAVAIKRFANANGRGGLDSISKLHLGE
jgi:hypothetical protein